MISALINFFQKLLKSIKIDIYWNFVVCVSTQLSFTNVLSVCVCVISFQCRCLNFHFQFWSRKDCPKVRAVCVDAPPHLGQGPSWMPFGFFFTMNHIFTHKGKWQHDVPKSTTSREKFRTRNVFVDIARTTFPSIK